MILEWQLSNSFSLNSWPCSSDTRVQELIPNTSHVISMLNKYRPCLANFLQISFIGLFQLSCAVHSLNSASLWNPLQYRHHWFADFQWSWRPLYFRATFPRHVLAMQTSSLHGVRFQSDQSSLLMHLNAVVGCLRSLHSITHHSVVDA